MAFFGLTALGSQNCFSQADRRTRNLHIFDSHDFQKAWTSTIGPDEKVAKVSCIGAIMKALFRGPIPPSDQYEVIRLTLKFKLPEAYLIFRLVCKLILKASIEEINNIDAVLSQIEIALEQNESLFESPTVISFQLYMDIMHKLSKEAEEQEKAKLTGRDAVRSNGSSSSNHSSQNATRLDRMKEDTRTKQSTPLISSQEIGWEKQELRRPEAGREGSEITKFAAALIKNGVYY